MVWTGFGQVFFFAWLGLVWVGYYVLELFVGRWAALGSACAIFFGVVFGIAELVHQAQ